MRSMPRRRGSTSSKRRAWSTSPAGLPSLAAFSRRTGRACWPGSIASTRAAPRLSASNAKAPEPAQQSATESPSRRWPSQSNSACFTRSGRGRVASPGGAASRRPRNAPAMMRSPVDFGEATRMLWAIMAPTSIAPLPRELEADPGRRRDPDAARRARSPAVGRGHDDGARAAVHVRARGVARRGARRRAARARARGRGGRSSPTRRAGSRGARAARAARASPACCWSPRTAPSASTGRWSASPASTTRVSWC